MSTFADLLRERAEVHVWCLGRCRRHEDFDLASWVASGHGDEPAIRRRWICSACGGEGKVTLSYPHSSGYARTFSHRERSGGPLIRNVNACSGNVGD